MVMKIRFWLSIAVAACVAVTVLIMAAYLQAGLIAFGLDMIVLIMIGAISCWMIVDPRFKTIPAVVSGLAFVFCVLGFMELAIFRPAVTYNDMHHIANLRFLMTEVNYDVAAIGDIDAAIDAAWLPALTLFVGCFVAGFLTSKISITGNRSEPGRKTRIAVFAGMGFLAAAAIVLNLSSLYQWEIVPYSADRWVRFSIPMIILAVDVFVQKAGLEMTAKGTPIDVRWHAAGLIAIVITFYGIALPRILNYVASVPILWLVAAIPLGLAFVAWTAMESFAKQHRIGRLVAIETVAAGLIVIETYLMMMMFSINFQ